MFQFPQLDVVQTVGDLFAVTGNERHGGATVQQLDSGLDLVNADPNFLRDLRDDFLHVPRGSSGPVSFEAGEFATWAVTDFGTLVAERRPSHGCSARSEWLGLIW